MDTVTTIEAYEKTPSGAHKITFLGGTVAGTRDDVVGALAEKIAAAGDDANPVAIRLEAHNSKLFVQSMEEITPPDELSGPEDIPADDDPGEAANPPAPVESMETMIDSDQEIVQSEPLRVVSNAVNMAHVLVNDLEEQLATVGLSHKLVAQIQAHLGQAGTELREAKTD